MKSSARPRPWIGVNTQVKFHTVARVTKIAKTSGGSGGGGGGGGGSVGGGSWAAVEHYYLGLMNCTRTGGHSVLLGLDGLGKPVPFQLDTLVFNRKIQDVVFKTPVRPTRGKFTLSDAPGLGLELDEDELKKRMVPWESSAARG